MYIQLHLKCFCLEYERLKNIPSGTIQQAIIQYGKKGAWPKLEVGQIDAVEFGDLFSAECSHVVRILYRICLLK